MGRPLKIFQLLSIGGIKELSVQSRTKECVDHVGLLLQSKPSNLCWLSTPNNLVKNFLPNTLLLVLPIPSNVVEMEDVKDPFHNGDSLILNSLDWLKKKNIHTLLQLLVLLETVNTTLQTLLLRLLLEDTNVA